MLDAITIAIAITVAITITITITITIAIAIAGLASLAFGLRWIDRTSAETDNREGEQRAREVELSGHADVSVGPFAWRVGDLTCMVPSGEPQVSPRCDYKSA
jgi:hypothetical protein